MILEIKKTKYVNFDDNGNIVSISSKSSETHNSIQVEVSDIEALISGKEQFHQYHVIFDTIKKEYVLKHVFNEEQINLDINVSIYKLPTKNIQRPDILVEQNITDKKWRFYLDNAIRDNFKTKNIHVDKILYFSLCKYNDPHQLQKIIKFTIGELLNSQIIEYDFDTDLELDSGALSVYTTKRLETYLHEVIE